MTTIVLFAVAGITLICLEVILPGLILGILGLIASMTSIILVFTTEQMPTLFDGFGGRFLLVSIILIGSMITFLTWLNYFDKLPLAKGLLIRETSNSKDEAIESDQLIGAEGHTITDLNPMGKVDIKDVLARHEFVAENGFIKAGTPIKVIKIKNNQFIVRAQNNQELDT